MRLSRRVSGLLLAFGVWSWIIWPTFLKNIAADPRSWHHGPTAFLLVHLVLTVLSLTFGTAIGLLGWTGLRAARQPDLPASNQPTSNQAASNQGASNPPTSNQAASNQGASNPPAAPLPSPELPSAEQIQPVDTRR